MCCKGQKDKGAMGKGQKDIGTEKGTQGHRDTGTQGKKDNGTTKFNILELLCCILGTCTFLFVSTLLSAYVERFIVTRMREYFLMKDLRHLSASILSLPLSIFPVFYAKTQISQTPNLKFPQTLFGSSYLKDKMELPSFL